MAFDFPASPTIGQVFQPAAGTVWRYDGEKWVGGAAGAALLEVSDTAPANPVDRMLWYESDSGGLYLRFNDTNTTQWIQVNSSNAPMPPKDGGEYVFCNGVWRLKSQFFDVAGKGTQDIAVPTWAKACELTGHLYCLTAGTYTGVQVSLDGTTFQGASNSYTYMGSHHSMASGNYFTQAVTSGTSAPIVLPGTGHSNASVPVSFTAHLNLVRTGATLFGMRAYSREYVDAGGRNSQKTEIYSYVATGSGAEIKIIRVLAGAAWAGSSLINVTWYGA